MDFRTLSYVIAIAEHQNLTKAAESLYVGQPTLSKFLSSLEEELGLKLFRRLGNRYKLTYAGERYVERAAQILQLKEDLDAEMADILKRDVGVLRAAFPTMRGSYLLPGVLPAFQQRHPNVKVTVLEGSSAENDRRLLDGQVDLAFYSKPMAENPLIEYRTLAREELLLFARRGHPLGKLARPGTDGGWPRLDLPLLPRERILLLKPEQRTRQIVDNILRENKIHLENTLCVSNTHTVMGLVASGYGVALLFDTCLRHWTEPGSIECYRIREEPILCDFVAANRRADYLPRYALDFIEIVKNEVTVPLK